MGNIWYYSSQIHHTQGLNFSRLLSSEDYRYSAHRLTKSNFMPQKKDILLRLLGVQQDNLDVESIKKP